MEIVALLEANVKAGMAEFMRGLRLVNYRGEIEALPKVAEVGDVRCVSGRALPLRGLRQGRRRGVEEDLHGGRPVRLLHEG